MSKEDNLDNVDADVNKEGVENKNTPPDNSVEKLVQEKVEENLKPIKNKLNDAYKQRDEAMKKLAELEQKQKEEHMKRLEEEGKHKELLEIRLAEETARREALEKRNTELSRDVKVRSSLSGLDFRNERAIDIAYKEIVGNLVQDENGVWKHTSGVSIEDYVMAFARDEDNAFLFKVKGNSGGGTSPTSGGTPTNKKKSLFDYSQEEIIKMAQEGKLR
jgi:hypothetical protein